MLICLGPLWNMAAPKASSPSTLSFRFLFTLFLLNHFITAYNEASSSIPSPDDLLQGQLLETPRVQCGESRIRVSLATNEPFGGNVYAKGFFAKDVCRVKGNGRGNTANITIPVAADCGMRRRRIVSPRGLVLEITVVVMFHPRFLTRNDRAYHIQCMYMEVAAEKVTQRLDVR